MLTVQCVPIDCPPMRLTAIQNNDNNAGIKISIYWYNIPIKHIYGIVCVIRAIRVMAVVSARYSYCSAVDSVVLT